MIPIIRQFNKNYTLVLMCAGGKLMGKLADIIRISNKKIKLIGLDVNYKNLINNKKFFDKTYTIPRPNSPNFIKHLLKILCNENMIILVPGSDEEAVEVSKKINIFKKNDIVCNVMDYKVIKSISDKYKLYQQCKKILGDNYIESYLIEDNRKLDIYAKHLGYPENDLIIKPRVGRGRRDTFKISNKINKKNIKSKDIPINISLEDFKKTIKINNNDFIIMKFIEGEALTIDVLAKSGELKLYVVRKWLKNWRFPFPGQELLKEKNIEKLILKLFTIYKFHGLFDIDLIKNNDEKIYLLEINPRPSGSILVTEKLGINIFSFLQLVLLNKKFEIPIMKTKKVINAI